MSNIDKQSVQAVADLKAGYTLGHADVAILNELARIALASLEAKPLGYIDAEYAEILKSGHVESCSVYAESGEGCFPVYTAPPAPVSVPDALPENDVEEGNDIDYMEPSEVYAFGRTAGWNACRAAMLHAGNHPVIPDGWTGSDEANAALIMLDRIETVDSVDDDRIEGIKRIIRALSAAQQQEVK